MAAAIFCTQWWISGREDAARVHLRCEDGSVVVVEAVVIKQALKRRRLQDGAIVFRHRIIRVDSLIVAPDHRTGGLGIVISARHNHPTRLLTMPAQEVDLLRETLVQRLDRWAQRSNGARTNNHTSVTRSAAGV